MSGWIVSHGVTAAWATRRYGTWFEDAAHRDPSIVEAAEGMAVGGHRRMALAGIRPTGDADRR